MTKNISQKQIVLLCGDIILISFAIYLSPILYFKILLNPLTVFHPTDYFLLLSCVFLFYIFNLYELESVFSKTRMVADFFLAVLVVNIINSAFFYFFHLRPYSSWVILINSILILILLLSWRVFFYNIAGISQNKIRVLILGSGKTGIAVYSAMKDIKDYQVIGFTDDDDRQGLLIDGLPILGKNDSLQELIKKYEINKIIVALNGKTKPELFQELVKIKFNGVTVYEMPTFYEKITKTIPVLHTSDVWISYADIYSMRINIYNLKIKNILDKIFALSFLIITLPVLILIAVAIKLDSRGPVFYIQNRVGLKGDIFKLIKFRTMTVGCENDRRFVERRRDPRITRMGKILRIPRIDEIPQLWNVLRGDMSLIGPRALMEEEVSEFTQKVPYFSLRHSVFPGITGWAQINYKHGSTVKDGLEKLQYDLYYVKRVSFLLDAYILLRTVKVVLLGIGSK